MELKPGYKLTEVGVIPEDWGNTKINNITTKVGSGITPTGGNRVYKQEGRPFLRSQNVGWGCLLLDDIAFIDEGTHSTFPETEIQIGDVFLNITGASIGRSSIADFRVAGGNVNQHVCIIRTNDSLLMPRFLNFILLSSLGQRQIDSFQAGGNRQGLNFSQVRSISIPIPPIPEQRSIATALSDMDELLGGLDRLITKKRDLKQSAMQQLLTGKTRLSGFDGEWGVKPLGEIATIRDGTHQTPRYVNSGIPFYSVEHVTSGDFNNTKFISKEEHQALTKFFKIEKGDILMTRIGSIGDCKLIDWDVDASFYVSLALLKIQEGYSAAYITHYSNTEAFKKETELNSLQSAIPRKINLGPISNIKIKVPPLPEQNAIASILSDMDTEIATLEQRRNKTRDLKQAMMQELLTGRIRLL
jgi:type I restriction enzyme S subunit